MESEYPEAGAVAAARMAVVLPERMPPIEAR